MIRSGGASALLVVKLDRLTRSVRDLGELVEGYFADPDGPALLSVSEQIDTRTAAGRLVLNVLGAVSQWEGGHRRADFCGYAPWPTRARTRAARRRSATVSRASGWPRADEQAVIREARALRARGSPSAPWLLSFTTSASVLHWPHVRCGSGSAHGGGMSPKTGRPRARIPRP